MNNDPDYIQYKINRLTMINLKKFLTESPFNYTAKIIHNEYQGFITQIYTKSGTFYFIYRMSAADKTLIFELSTGLHCPSDNKSIVYQKLAEINASMHTTNFRMDENGHIYLHSEYIFIDYPVSKQRFHEITDFMISIVTAKISFIESCLY